MDKPVNSPGASGQDQAKKKRRRSKKPEGGVSVPTSPVGSASTLSAVNFFTTIRYLLSVYIVQHNHSIGGFFTEELYFPVCIGRAKASSRETRGG
jgi:hypothetical protein